MLTSSTWKYSHDSNVDGGSEQLQKKTHKMNVEEITFT